MKTFFRDYYVFGTTIKNQRNSKEDLFFSTFLILDKIFSNIGKELENYNLDKTVLSPQIFSAGTPMAILAAPNAGNNGVEPASGFVHQSH